MNPAIETKASKPIIYQLLPRLFGNRVTHLVQNGSKAENGCGTLNDLNENALQAIRDLGVTHLWLTGILQHATTTDYTSLGIPLVHPATVKGKAGSPYAVTDFFDLDPDLFDQPEQRWEAFEACRQRIQTAGLKLIIDFIPNHTARQYTHPEGLANGTNLGQLDDVFQAFSPQNHYFYLPGQPLELPNNREDQNGAFYQELPARATGNDCFSHQPSEFDWYETVKLNYGLYPLTGERCFEPRPKTWSYMLEVLLFWASKGIDGFRCDMVEMVPVEFWAWALPQVRTKYPHLIFIAEVYNPAHYPAFLHEAGFDFLYDKVGLYDELVSLLKGNGNAKAISGIWQNQEGFRHRMLRFMENHDEQRLASAAIAGDGKKALPAFVLTALFDQAPVMVYAGQELGEKAEGGSGFSGDDGKTTIFDYWSIPGIVRWNNNGKWDEKNLQGDEKELRKTYQSILKLAIGESAFSTGSFFDLQFFNEVNPHFPKEKMYAFLRYQEENRFLVVCHFGTSDFWPRVIIPETAWNLMQIPVNAWYQFEDCLNGEKLEFHAHASFEADGGTAGIIIPVKAHGFRILKLIS